MRRAAEEDPLGRTLTLENLKGKGVRGKYLARVAKGTNLVRLSPEAARLFPAEEDVNKALLSLAELLRTLPDLQARSKRVARRRSRV